MKKIFTLVVVTLLAVCSLCACGTQGDVTDGEKIEFNDKTVSFISASVVFTPESKYEGKTLLSFMEDAKNSGNIDFTLSGTLLSSINGIKNREDFSYCWMLYTDDEDMSNSAWGTYDHDGKTYASASLGADSLHISANKTYIWVYSKLS